jgi:hypothetical protein
VPPNIEEILEEIMNVSHLVLVNINHFISLALYYLFFVARSDNLVE